MVCPEPLTQSDALSTLTSLGFTTPRPRETFAIPITFTHECNDACREGCPGESPSESAIDRLLQFCQGMETTRHMHDYDTDGTVIKVDDVAVQQSLGIRQRSPKWALALKYSPKEAVTKLLGITVQVNYYIEQSPLRFPPISHSITLLTVLV